MTSGSRGFALQHVLSHSSSIHVATYNHGAAYVLTGGQDRAIKLWNVKTGGLVKEYAGHGYEVLGISVAPDNARFASCGGDRAVLYWDVTAGQVVKRWSGHMSTVNAVAFSFDGNLLLSGGFDGTVRLWDCKSQQRMPIQVLDEARDSVTCLVVRGHEVLVGCVDGNVRSYDVRKGKLTADFFEKPVTSVHLLKDGQTFLVSTLDSTIRLMDRERGELLQTFRGHRNDSYKSRACVGHGEATVLAGDEDGLVHIWDLESGKKTGEVKAHEKVVTWVEHHPTAVKQMVTAGADGKAKLWGPA